MSEQTTNIDVTEAKITCPCCGKPTIDKPINFNSYVLDHFISCIITHVPFSHKYDIYNGKISITCTQLTDAETMLSREVAEQLQQAVINNRINESFSIALANSIYLMLRIKEVSVSSVDSSSTYRPQEVAKAVAKDIIATINQKESDTSLEDLLSPYYDKITDPALVSNVPSNMLVYTQEAHDKVYSLLLESGFDENFWKGIELA